MKTKTKHILIVVLLIWLVPAITQALYQPIGIVKLLIQHQFATVFSSTYDISTPAGSDSPSEADDRMRETKAGVQERSNVDHYWPLTGTEVSDADAGIHRKVLFQSPIASTPTVAANHGDLRIKDVGGKAELHWTDEDENEIQLTSAGSIKGGAVAGDTTITGTLDVTGAAEVTGVATIGDGSLTKTSAAPSTDAMIANKKYVDDQITANADPSYTGGESHTFVGGLIIKMGVTGVVSANSDVTVTFGSAFPNAIISACITSNYTAGSHFEWSVHNLATNSIKVRNGDGATATANWIAIGH